MPRPLPIAAALLAAALALAGCGTAGSGSDDSSGDFQGVQGQVAQAVEDLESAAGKGDQDRVCSELLARALVDRLEARPGGCPRAVDAALEDLDTTDLTVKSVQVSGPNATVRVATDVGDGPDQPATLRLVREDNRWKLSAPA